MKRKLQAIASLFLLSAFLLAAGNPAISNDYIEIAEYIGLDFELTETETITDERVTEEVQSILTANGMQTPITDRNAEEGDWVSIDYTGLVDGVAISEVTEASYNLQIGADDFYIPGFDQQLIGHGQGEQFEFDFALPEDYSDASLAGTTVHWIVTISNLYTLETPELTDEFVQSIIGMEGVTTAEDYREYVRSQLQSQADQVASAANEEAIYRALDEQTTVKSYPKEELETAVEEEQAIYEGQAALVGLSLEDYVTQMLNFSMDEFESQLQQNAEEKIRQKLVVDAIAEAEDLTISDEEYEENLESFAIEYGFAGADEISSMYSKEDIHAQMQQKKVFDFLIENGNPVEEGEAATKDQKKSPIRTVMTVLIVLLIIVVIALFVLRAAMIRKRRKRRQARKKNRTHEE